MEKDSFRRCSHPRKGVSGARGAVSCRWRGLLPRHDALLHFCARISTRLFYRKSRYGYRHVRFDVQMSIGLGDWIRSLGRSYPLWSYSSLCFFARAPSPPGGGDGGPGWAGGSLTRGRTPTMLAFWAVDSHPDSLPRASAAAELSEEVQRAHLR